MTQRRGSTDGGGSVTAVQYGVGPIGTRVAETAARRVVEFVGAVDVDPAKVGKDLGEPVGLDRTLDVTVTEDPDAALATEPDVVFHSTVSSVADAKPQLERAMAAGADVVSTCEELAYPWWNHADVADHLAATASSHGATVLGTGINPGFAMDAFPAVVTTPCQAVERILVERVQDAAQRRRPLQEKIGTGRSTEAFREETAAEAGHVGLPESTAMLAAALGWELQRIETAIEPVVADEPVKSDYFRVDVGEVAGIAQMAEGWVEGEPRIELDLRMSLGAADPHDAVTIRGTPDIECRIEGGLHGDVTTPAVVVNAASSVRATSPGLVTMLDLPSLARR